MATTPVQGEPRRARASWIKKLAALLLGIVSALAVGELYVRSLDSVELGFAYRHGVFTRPQEFIFDSTRNIWGFHDVEPRPATSDATRVLLLGDSYLAAYYLARSETLGPRIEFRLNELAEGPFEVTSLGHPGWGQKDQLAAFSEHGESVAPNVVVTLLLVFNDVRNNSEVLNAMGADESANAERFLPGWRKIPAEEAPYFVVRRSVLNQLVSYRLAKGDGGAPPDVIPVDYFVYRPEPDADWTAAWQSTEDLLLETKAYAEQLGARYAIASTSTAHGVRGKVDGLAYLKRTYPAMRALEWDLDLPDARLGAFSETHGIPFLPIEPEFRKLTREGRQLHWRYDGHWNAEGTDRAANLIADFVLDVLDSAGD